MVLLLFHDHNRLWKREPVDTDTSTASSWCYFSFPSPDPSSRSTRSKPSPIACAPRRVNGSKPHLWHEHSFFFTSLGEVLTDFGRNFDKREGQPPVEPNQIEKRYPVASVCLICSDLWFVTIGRIGGIGRMLQGAEKGRDVGGPGGVARGRERTCCLCLFFNKDDSVRGLAGAQVSVERAVLAGGRACVCLGRRPAARSCFRVFFFFQRQGKRGEGVGRGGGNEILEGVSDVRVGCWKFS